MHQTTFSKNQLPLHMLPNRSIARIVMKFLKLAGVAIAALAISSCDRGLKPLEVRETRPLTDVDRATSFIAVMPPDWRQVAATKFRDFNCKFSENGEVYVSVGSGGIKDNADRWLRQFGQEKPDVKVEELQRIAMLGTEGYLLESRGEYKGMEGVYLQDAALLGALVQSRDGVLVTVKMVGKAEDVAAQHENFRKFCNDLKWRDGNE